MPQIRRKLEQRGQHEPALVQARMRDFEPRRVNCESAVEQDIDIDRPRSFGLSSAFAAQLQLDLLSPRQKEQWKQIRFSFCDQVQKKPLLFEVHRFGFVHRRDAPDAQIRRAQAIKGGLQRLFAVAEVGAQR